MKSLPDSELIAAVKRGDQSAFDALFLRWYPQVKRFILSLVKDPALSEDLAQTVFIKVWNARGMLSPQLSIRSYLFVLSRNAALDVLRSKHYLLQNLFPASPDCFHDASPAAGCLQDEPFPIQVGPGNRRYDGPFHTDRRETFGTGAERHTAFLELILFFLPGTLRNAPGFFVL